MNSNLCCSRKELKKKAHYNNDACSTLPFSKSGCLAFQPTNLMETLQFTLHISCQNSFCFASPLLSYWKALGNWLKALIFASWMGAKIPRLLFMAWKSLKTDWILQTCFPLECEFFVSVLLSLLGWLKKPAASASAPATPIKKFPDRVTFQTRKCITSLGFFAIPTLRCRLGFPRRKAFLSTAIATPCKVCTSSCLLRTRSCTSFIFAQPFNAKSHIMWSHWKSCPDKKWNIGLKWEQQTYVRKCIFQPSLHLLHSQFAQGLAALDKARAKAAFVDYGKSFCLHNCMELGQSARPNITLGLLRLTSYIGH